MNLHSSFELAITDLRISTRCKQKVYSARQVTPRKQIRSTIVCRLRSILSDCRRNGGNLYVPDSNSQLKSCEFRLGVNKKFTQRVELPLDNTLY